MLQGKEGERERGREGGREGKRERWGREWRVFSTGTRVKRERFAGDT